MNRREWNLFWDMPLRNKLLLSSMSVSTVVLLLASFAFWVYDFRETRHTQEEELRHLADLIVRSNDAAVQLQQPDAAQKSLYELLGRNLEIEEAVLFDAQGRPFAVYSRHAVRLISSTLSQPQQQDVLLERERQMALAPYRPPFREQGADFDLWSGYMDVYMSLSDENGRINTVFLRANLERFYLRMGSYLSVLAVVVLLGLGTAYLLSLFFQRLITTPILALSDMATRITTSRDYSLRLPPQGQDEIGSLMQAFNEMLAQVQQQNQHLIQAKNMAERSAVTKQQFLANMSHEIRTPMNGVIGVTELLADTPLNRQQEHYLDVIRRSADHLMVIIDDILDLSKIESGMMRLDDHIFYPQQLLQHVRSVYAPKASKKGLSLHVHCDPQVPVALKGDGVRLQQILLNLLSNAIKFTAQGQVSLRCQLLSSSDTSLLLGFEVEDTGIGIAEDQQESIFHIFTQVGEDTARKYGGTGLGLSICKRLVELQGGDMRVHSRRGQGSCFCFEIPYRLAEQVSSPMEVSSAMTVIPFPVTSTQQYRVLLAEDNEVNQMLVRVLLGKWGYEVQVAADGRQALELLEQQPFDLVLMDVHMPNMDGYEATQAIRSSGKRYAKLPVIAMTASALKGEEERCLQVGMDDYLSKPIDKQKLQQKLQQWIVVEQVVG